MKHVIKLTKSIYGAFWREVTERDGPLKLCYEEFNRLRPLPRRTTMCILTIKDRKFESSNRIKLWWPNSSYKISIGGISYELVGEDGHVYGGRFFVPPYWYEELHRYKVIHCKVETV